MVRLVAVVALLLVAPRSARADDLDELRAQVEQALGAGNTDEINDHIELAMRKASMANASVRLGRIELFAAELEADRPTVKTGERARKALLHLGTDPVARMAELRWHVSAAQVALAAGRLGAAAMHLQAGRAAMARVAGPATGKGAKAGSTTGAAAGADKPALGATDLLRDRTRLDDTERGLLAQLRRAVEAKESLSPGHVAALAACALGETLKPNAAGDEPLPPRVRPSGEGLAGKLDRALATAEQREIEDAAARGEGKLAATARSRHAETLLRIGRTADAVAARKQALAWYRDNGTLDQVVVEARWIAERADKNPRALFTARREEVREIQRGLAKLVGPARAVAQARHRGEFAALVEAAAAVAAQPGFRGGIELIEPIDLVRDRAAWDQVALFADTARWKRLGGAGGEITKMLEAIAGEDVGHALDALSLVDNLASPAARARQKASEAMARGEATPADPPSLKPSLITARLGGRTLVIYGRLDEARVAIGVLPAKAPARVLTVRLSAAEEARLVTRLRAGLRDGADGWHEPARQLYAQLVAPIEALLGDSAVVIPDGSMVALPFGALENGGGQLVAETTTITFWPSLLALSSRHTNAIAPQSALLFGVPRFVEPGAEPLPSAEREIASLKKVLAGAGRNARQLASATSVAQLVAETGLYDVIHVASRLRLDSEMPVVGALLTASAPLFAFDLARLGLRANVLVLDTPSPTRELPPAAMARGLAGIIGASLAFPARSLVVAVQAPDGPSRAALFARMYERYASGESPSLALAGAQRDMAGGKLEQPLLLAAGADPIGDASRFVHPRYWAGFTAWGEP